MQTCTSTKFIVPEVHFHTKSNGASPVVIARKKAKLFKFLYSQTRRYPNIVWQIHTKPCYHPTPTEISATSWTEMELVS